MVEDDQTVMQYSYFHTKICTIFLCYTLPLIDKSPVHSINITMEKKQDRGRNMINSSSVCESTVLRLCTLSVLICQEPATEIPMI